jgi:hypothetical protein
MGFIVKINPAGIEKVILESSSEPWQDLCLFVWPIIRSHLKRIDRSLKKTAYGIIKKEIPRPQTLLTGLKIGEKPFVRN